MVKDAVKQIVKTADVSDWKNPLLDNPQNIQAYVQDFFGGGPALIRDDGKKKHFLDICEKLIVSAPDRKHREWAYLIIANLYGTMLKDVISEKVEQSLGSVTMEEVNAKTNELVESTVKFAEIRKQMSEVEGKIQTARNDLNDKVKNKSIHEFVAYIKYAADEFGTEEEKTVVYELAERIIKKSKNTKKKHGKSKRTI